MLSKLASMSISSLRKLDDEPNKFYDRKHDLYEAALLTRCYTQHALRPYIDSEINRIRHFIKIPFITKGIKFIGLGKRELILVLFVRLFGLCLFRFVGFLFLLRSGKGCGL